LYVDARDDGDGVAIIEEQELVVNDTLRIVAVQNEFQTSRTGRVSLELYLKENLDESANLSGSDGPVNVTIPTRLGDDYWSESIQSDSVTYQGVNTSAFPDANESYVSALEIQVDSLDNVSVNSVGVQSEPSGKAVKANVGPPDENEQTNDLYPSSGTADTGSLSDFANMQEDDGNISELRGISAPNKRSFDVTTTTDNAAAGDYTLEVQVGSGSSFQGGGIDVTVSDVDGNIGIGTITGSGLFTIDLDPSAEGDITVQYEGKNQNTRLNIQFQRLVQS